MDFDVLIIGAGAVGLAIAKELSKRCSCLVVERNEKFGCETSSRNSEVVHSGLYYPQNSLKARLCIEGNPLIYEHCLKYSIDFNKCGKLVISLLDDNSERINEIFENASLCGAGGVEFLSKATASELEPEIKFGEAFLAKSTGVVDTHRLMQSFEAIAASNNSTFLYRHNVTSISKTIDGYKTTLKSQDGDCYDVESVIVVNSAGLGSEEIAKMLGIEDESLKLYYCKGHYFRIANTSKFNFRHLIYPVQEKNKPGLGIHLTVDLNESAKLGPDTLYLSDNLIDYDVPLELKNKFFDYASKYIKNIAIEDISPDYSGIRPKLQSDGGAFRDFYIKEESSRGLSGFINLIGIESPGLSSSLAIAKYISNLI